MGLTVDPEFQALIPPLTAEERDQLEANLRAEGCRDPLVVWNGVLLDGHHRFAICTTHGITFTVAEQACADREEAKAWIIRHQFGRRNLTLFQRAELALALEPLIAAEAYRRQAAGTLPSIEGKVDRHDSNTDARLAQVAGIGESSLYRARVIVQRGTDEEKAELRAGRKRINGVYDTVRARIGTPKRIMVRKKGGPPSIPPVRDDGTLAVIAELKAVVAEIRRIRKENHDQMGRVRWNSHEIDKRKQTLILNTVEQKLDELIHRYGPGRSSSGLRSLSEESHHVDTRKSRTTPAHAGDAADVSDRKTVAG